MFVLCVKNYSMFQSPKEKKKNIQMIIIILIEQSLQIACTHTYVPRQTLFQMIKLVVTAPHCVWMKKAHPGIHHFLTSLHELAWPSPAQPKVLHSEHQDLSLPKQS